MSEVLPLIRAVAFVGGSFTQRAMATLVMGGANLVMPRESRTEFRFFTEVSAARARLDAL